MLLKHPQRAINSKTTYPRAILKRVEEHFCVPWNNKLDDTVEFIYELDNGEEVKETFTYSLEKSSFLAKAIYKITGKYPNKEIAFDTDLIIGKVCYIKVVEFEFKYNQNYKMVMLMGLYDENYAKKSADNSTDKKVLHE